MLSRTPRRGRPVLVGALATPVAVLALAAPAAAVPAAAGAPTAAAAAPAPEPGPEPIVESRPSERLRVADRASTGVPAGQRLRAYRGPCTITRDGTKLVGRRIDCDLRIEASGVVIRRSLVNGTISTAGVRGDSSFRLVRSTVDASPRGSRMVTVVGEVRFRVVGSEIRGGNRSINCWDRCVVEQSWVHGQDTDLSGRTHESGIRMGTRGRFVGNRIACDAPNVAPDAGCSAPLTGYGDFGPVRHNLIRGNLFLATTGGTCAYGGSSGGKPYSGSVSRIRFVDNLFQRGRSGRCGWYSPVMDFDRSAPGNQFVGNRWLGGGAVRP